MTDQDHQPPPNGAPEPPQPDLVECPSCLEPVRPNADVCRHCGRLLQNAKHCPQCAELVRVAARKCRYCGYDFHEDPLHAFHDRGDKALDEIVRRVNTDPLGGMICEQSLTNLFLPPEIRLSRREIVITRWQFFGLRKFQQKVALRRVASVRSTRGIFWSSLVCETLGGAMADLVIDGLNKEESSDMATCIENLTIRKNQAL